MKYAKHLITALLSVMVLNAVLLTAVEARPDGAQRAPRPPSCVISSRFRILDFMSRILSYLDKNKFCVR